MNRRRRSRGGSWLLRLSLSYVVLLGLLYLLLRYVGEQRWFTTTALYVPSAIYGVPLLLLAALSLRRRRWGALWVVGLGSVFWFVCFMSFTWPLKAISAARADVGGQLPTGRTSLRLFTQNVHNLNELESVARQIVEQQPDLVLLQEAAKVSVAWWRQRIPELEWVQRDEFLLGTRDWHVEAIERPAQQMVKSGLQIPRYLRCTLSRGDQRLVVYHLHPPSPKQDFRYLFHQLRTLSPLAPAAGAVWVTSQKRLGVMQAISYDARQQSVPVLVAGDTNLPPLSWALNEVFYDFEDAFVEVGRGFGYTFPKPLPWLRIDRVLGRNGVHFERAQVLPANDSDHLALVVELML